MLKKLSRPDNPPIGVPAAKDRLRLDTSDRDMDLDRLLRAAAEAVEVRTGLVMAPTQYEYRVDLWPGFSPLRLPVAPVRDVTEVVYLDEDGAEQTVASSSWYFDRTSEGADLRFDSDYSGPALYERPGSLRVRFTAGYDDPAASGAGDDPELVLPATAEMAILFLVGHWHEHAESVAATQTYEVPETFELLAGQMRIFR